MDKLEKKLEELSAYLKIIEHYRNVGSLMYWDMTTGMPENAAEGRAETMSFMQMQAHNLSVSKEIHDFIKFFEKNEEKLDFVQKRMVHELKKNYEKEKIFPEEFIKEFSLAASRGQLAWEKAKNEDNFEIFKPDLEKIVELTKKSIKYKGYKGNKYNALLDDYEPGLTVEKLDKVFDELRDGIVNILKKINNSGTEISNVFEGKEFPKENQKRFCIKILKTMGFDFKSGRMDETEHPYTLDMSNKDVRITNHYYLNDFTSAMFSAIHEGGHGIYEQNIPDYLEGTGLNVAASMAIHESQSRFYENIIGRNKAFCGYLYEEAKKEFPNQFEFINEEEFYNTINKVQPSLIRTEVDELTYSIHVIIRYEIEKLLINDKIQVADLPRVWNEKYKEYLGIEPTSDKVGVLQDMHWSDGSFGYFPSYALGNLYGAQMLNEMVKDIPNIYDEIATGDLSSVYEWLKENVHEYANLYDPSDLIKRITGEELQAKYFIEYLDKKYKEIYNY